MSELNEKLAKWANVPYCKCTYDTIHCDDPCPRFTTNLNAIDKWLFPELLKRGFYIGIGAEKSGWECWIFEGEPVEGDPFQEYKVKVLADTLALAICKAIEQLIKEESCLSSK